VVVAPPTEPTPPVIPETPTPEPDTPEEENGQGGSDLPETEEPPTPPVVTPPSQNPVVRVAEVVKEQVKKSKDKRSKKKKDKKDKASKAEKNDRTTPWLHVSGLQAGRRLSFATVLRVRATDNHKIDGLSLWIDGRKKQKGKSANLSYTIFGAFYRGNHSIEAIADDKRGNTKTMNAQVRNGVVVSIRYVGRVR
jgi:hypothetical protein